MSNKRTALIWVSKTAGLDNFIRQLLSLGNWKVYCFKQNKSFFERLGLRVAVLERANIRNFDLLVCNWESIESGCFNYKQADDLLQADKQQFILSALADSSQTSIICDPSDYEDFVMRLRSLDEIDSDFCERLVVRVIAALGQHNVSLANFRLLCLREERLRQKKEKDKLPF